MTADIDQAALISQLNGPIPIDVSILEKISSLFLALPQPPASTDGDAPPRALAINSNAKALAAAPSPTLVTSAFQFDHPEQLASDAAGVMQKFVDMLQELASVDAANPGEQAWVPRWSSLRIKYDELLRKSVSIAQDGSQYLLGFNTQVVDHFSKDNVDWVQDKNLIDVFIKNASGDNAIVQSQQLSQAFTDLRRDVEAFRSQFSDYSIAKGQQYDQNARNLQGNMDRLQAEITRYQSTASQIERALSLVTGPGFLFGWLIAQLLGGLGITSVDSARSALDVTYREEANLRRQKDDVQRQAADVASQGSRLLQIRHVLDVLVNDVTDISGRLNRFAGSWAAEHSEFVELGELLKNADNSVSQHAFTLRLGLVARSNSLLAADMRVYINFLSLGGFDPRVAIS